MLIGVKRLYIALVYNKIGDKCFFSVYLLSYYRI